MPRLAINNRSASRPISGVERYATEVVPRVRESARLLGPRRSGLSGAAGHLWEQTSLVARLHRDEVLWSPCNTGPILLKRHVVTVHDIAPVDHPEWFSPRYGQWLAKLTRGLVANAAHLLTVSEFTKARLCEALGASPDQVTVAPNGVDDRFRSAPPQLTAEQRRDLGVPEGPYLLTLSTAEPRKNLPRLLSAAVEAMRHHPDVCLVVAGRAGSSRIFADDDEATSGSAQVRRIGYVPDELLPSLYASASGFLYAPLYEGFGLPPLEAMAVGTPCVLSDIPALRELGAPARWADPTSSDSIGAQILALLDDGGLASSEELRGYGLQYSWESSGLRIKDVLARLGVEP